MTEPTVAAAAPTAPAEGSLRRFLTNPLAVASSVILIVIVGFAAFAQLIAPYDPNFADVRALLSPSSPDHLLGTDRAGRDIFSRLVIGAQVTLLAAGLALVIAMMIGIPAGLLAGYYGKWFDSLSSWASGLLMALPAILVLLSVRAVVGPSVWVSMIVFGILMAPGFFRLVRTSVSVVRNELYVDAAKVSGLSDWSIIGKHVLGVVRAPIIVQSGLVIGIAIGAQSGLEFLGIGDRQVPTWGSQLTDAFAAIYTSPILIVWPAGAIGLSCIAFGILANGIRDALEDRGIVTAPRTKAPAATGTISVLERPAATADADAAHPAASDVLLQVSNLKVGYRQNDGSDKVVVNDVSLHVARGEVLGLVGESGSGKSQTSFSVLGLLPAGGRIIDGSIQLGGRDLTTLSGREISALRGSTMAYVPQEPISNLDPAFTIGSQLVEPMRVKLKLSKAQATARALELLDSVGIRDPKRTFGAYPHEISGGMAQRVLIAGAISCDPELLIADEPTTALDVTVQAEVLDVIRTLQRERNMAVLLVTHNFGVVADICDRVAVMNAGRIVETNTTQLLFDAPAHPYTQKLLASTLDETEPRAGHDSRIGRG